MCAKSTKKDWCLFSVSEKKGPTIRLKRVQGITNTDNQNERLTIQLALNAKQKPISSNKITLPEQDSSATNSSGRVIGYIYGWETPPAAEDIAKAGYTHVLLTFGLFSTQTPGAINIDAISGFDLTSYVQSLHSNGVKALLSIGGASTNIPNTTVNFDQAVSLAGSPADFQSTFINNLTSLVSTYHLDGFDFDIESGLNGASSFSNPSSGCSTSVYSSSCDIYYLSNIINQFHTQTPQVMLTLAPQIANIAATQNFDATWGNYASLVMQTYNSLEWVAFQNYNAGCAYGVDLVCYPTGSNSLTSTADPAVAFSTDLLASWPATATSGQVTNFQPYIGYLQPSQVVIGYVVSNASGQTDGSPSVNPYLTQAKEAIQCLRTGESCATFNPSTTYPYTTYPSIGGVFAWSINYDATNQYQFATTMAPCVVEGNCS